MKTTNLADYLKTLDEDQIVAIGAKNGNGFVYIGKAGEQEFITKCFNDYLSNRKRKLKDYKEKLNQIVFKSPKMRDDDDNIEDAIYRYALSISKLTNCIAKHENYINTYEPVFNRKVRNSYTKDVDNCLAIIIDGFEDDGFWFKSEFDSN